jgi:hypothetical protein
LFSRIKSSLAKSKEKEYKIETYTLVKGIQLTSEKSVILEEGPTSLSEAQFITWTYLRSSETLEDAFINMNIEMNNMISLEMFTFIIEELKGMGLLYTSSSESDISTYIEEECKTVINADLVSDIRNKVNLKHLDMEIVLSAKEYIILKEIINGEYESIESKDWNTFFTLYKKEAISFI